MKARSILEVGPDMAQSGNSHERLFHDRMAELAELGTNLFTMTVDTPGGLGYAEDERHRHFSFKTTSKDLFLDLGKIAGVHGLSSLALLLYNGAKGEMFDRSQLFRVRLPKQDGSEFRFSMFVTTCIEGCGVYFHCSPAN